MAIEDLGPQHIGMAMEVDKDGTLVGFRLSRYERSLVDGVQQWRLFSDQSAWTIKLPAGTRIRCQPFGLVASGTHPIVGAPPAPGTMPAVAAEAPRTPESWLSPAPQG
ncbi:hypothetical protein [Actinacidiphila alni]|nr:hypothetical protein [Actinacidiphila alni]